MSETIYPLADGLAQQTAFSNIIRAQNEEKLSSEELRNEMKKALNGKAEDVNKRLGRDKDLISRLCSEE
jgi:hypothetical protein